MKKPDEHKILFVKRLKEGDLQVNFDYTNTIKEQEERGNTDTKSNMDPHEDLVGIMNECKSIVARCFNIPDGDALQEWKDRLRVDTIHISGEEKTEAVIISSTYRNDVKHKMALNTARILIEGDKYGIEAELRSLLQKLREEVDAWLFEGKCGPHMFNQPPKDEEGDEEPVAEGQEETTS